MKVGLLGFGTWGKNAARAIARVAELAVIVDPNPERMAEAVKTWEPWGCAIASEPFVAFRDCDAVWIATPAPRHAATVRDALGAGVHVLCEKPFVLDIEDAHNLADLARRQNRVLMAGHLSLFTEGHAFARSLPVPQGEFRKIRSIRRNTEASLSDHDVLWGLGPHDIAAIVDIMGSPTEIECAGTKHRVTANLSFAQGEATIELDWLSLNRHRSFSVNDVETAGAVDPVEPLLREAKFFIESCAAGDDRGKIAEAITVTETIYAMELAMNAALDPVEAA